MKSLKDRHHSWIGVSVIASSLVFLPGCSKKPERENTNPGTDAEVDDGGGVEDADRNKVEDYFLALSKISSAEAEKELLVEFGQWLTDNKYEISVREKNGKHELSCPFFPPVTPWVGHTFLDIENLNLLPVMKENAP